MAEPPERTLLAVEEKLTAKDTVTGRLERLDGGGSWRACYCELAGGRLRVLAPGRDPRPPDGADDSDSDADGVFVEALEELAVDAGGRGRRGATLNLTRCRVVGTSPQHGATAFKLVVDRARAASPRATSRAVLRRHVRLAPRVPPVPGRRRRAHPAAPRGVAPVQRAVRFHRRVAVEPLLPGRRPRRAQEVELAAARQRRRLREPAEPAASRGGVASAPVPLSSPLRPPLGTPPPRRPRRPATTAAPSAASRARGPSTARRREPARRQRRRRKCVPPHLRAGYAPSPPPPADAFEETGDAITGGFFAEEGSPWRTRGPRYGAAPSAKGIRRHNEDACADGPAPPAGLEGAAYFAVYDGHSGFDVAARCRDELHGLFYEEFQKSEDPAAALETSFLALDAAYCAEAARGDASPDAGATALALVLECGGGSSPRAVVANCGDCACVLGRKGAPVPLSAPHAPAPGSSEAARVEAAGGWVTAETDLCVGRLHAMDLADDEIFADAHERVRLNEIHRVCGEVAVTRAIGDVDFKGWPCDGRESPCFAYPEGHDGSFAADLLVATPEVVAEALRPGDSFLLLATDGLWDVVAPAEAVAVAGRRFDAGDHPKAVAAHLVDRALRLGSGDNVTVLLVQLEVARNAVRLRVGAAAPPVLEARRSTADRSEILVLEQAPAFGDGVGGGIGLYANGLRVLRDASPALLAAVREAGYPYVYRRWLRHDGTEVAVAEEKELCGDPELQSLGIRRWKLQQALCDAARAAGIVVEFGSRVEEVTEIPGGAVVRTAEGARKAKVIFGADGLKSQARRAVAGADLPAHFTGVTCLMGSAPVARPAGALANDLERDGWDAALLEPLRGPPDSVIRVGIFARDPLTTWVKGRVFLVGDAAHPPVPYIGQGAMQAMEDVGQRRAESWSYNLRREWSIRLQCLLHGTLPIMKPGVAYDYAADVRRHLDGDAAAPAPARAPLVVAGVAFAAAAVVALRKARA
ncbi:protein serine/threonine phosphatase [Aureococcus anophagefferens]|nr:protein serine/threonine phosphatase [Aureococcus anophagefferens]